MAVTACHCISISSGNRPRTRKGAVVRCVPFHHSRARTCQLPNPGPAPLPLLLPLLIECTICLLGGNIQLEAAGAGKEGGFGPWLQLREAPQSSAALEAVRLQQSTRLILAE